MLTPHEREHLYTANGFSPDNRHLLITSNSGNGYDNVGLLDVISKKIDWLTQDKWEIQAGSFSPDGKYGYVCSSFTPQTSVITVAERAFS